MSALSLKWLAAVAGLMTLIGACEREDRPCVERAFIVSNWTHPKCPKGTTGEFHVTDHGGFLMCKCDAGEPR